MCYALWDLESANGLGDFDSEGEALAVVRDLLDANDADYAEMLSLECAQDDGTFVVVATGRALAARALAGAAESCRSV
jgi:hypothetical protein